MSRTAEVIEKLQNPDHNIYHISLDGCEQGEFTESNILEICSRLLTDRRVQTLWLEGSAVSETAGDAIAQLVAANTPLKTLRLKKCNLASASASTIFKSLEKNSNLEFLDLTSNCIDGLACNALPMGTRLNNFILDGNNIGDAGASIVARLISQSTTLTRLRLFDCNITSTGFIAIADALRENELLEMLILGNNKAGTEGLVAIANAIRETSKLDQLSVFQPTFEDDYEPVVKAFGELLARTATLKHLLLPLRTEHNIAFLENLTAGLSRNTAQLGEIYVMGVPKINEMVNYLKTHDAAEGSKLLFTAVSLFRPTMCEFLIKSGVRAIDARDEDGNTALHRAVVDPRLRISSDLVRAVLSATRSTRTRHE